MSKEIEVEVTLDHDNVWINDVHYQDCKGQKIKVSSKTAMVLNDAKLITGYKQDGGK